ncbi:14077_t:CDS:2 [Acaulospora morrowiae]|uniref:14077_t:CDS:1 n=1 Tax=Acaulospora morrowiae TaxID=94023 RepID=A0A9N9B6N5_9GLOM|nr:14077_t:CDS:2 [Acaulospora morrowiae]
MNVREDQSIRLKLQASCVLKDSNKQTLQMTLNRLLSDVEKSETIKEYKSAEASRPLFLNESCTSHDRSNLSSERSRFRHRSNSSLSATMEKGKQRERETAAVASLPATTLARISRIDSRSEKKSFISEISKPLYSRSGSTLSEMSSKESSSRVSLDGSVIGEMKRYKESEVRRYNRTLCDEVANVGREDFSINNSFENRRKILLESMQEGNAVISRIIKSNEGMIKKIDEILTEVLVVICS